MTVLQAPGAEVDEKLVGRARADSVSDMRAMLLGALFAALAFGLIEGPPDMLRASYASGARARAEAKGASQVVSRPEGAREQPAVTTAADAAPVATPVPPGEVAAEPALPGETPKPAVPPGAAPKAGDAAPGLVRPLPLEAPDMRETLRAVPALSAFAGDFVPFTDTDVDAALERGGRSRRNVSVWTFLPAAFAWRPSPGRELWVLSGRSGAHALIAVIERKAGELELAASTLLEEPEATVAIGYNEQYPSQLVWSSCYGCAGEGGTIRSLDDGRIDFAYR